MPKGAKGHVGTKDSEDKQARKDIGNRKDMESKKENRKRGGIRNRWHALQYSLVPSVRPSVLRGSWQTVWRQQRGKSGALGKKLTWKGHPEGKPYQVSRGRRPLGQHLRFPR